MLLFIKEKYPNVKYISTGNASDNKAMLSINNRMGFKINQVRRSYKFTVEELKKGIAEID